MLWLELWLHRFSSFQCVLSCRKSALGQRSILWGVSHDYWCFNAIYLPMLISNFNLIKSCFWLTSTLWMIFFLLQSFTHHVVDCCGRRDEFHLILGNHHPFILMGSQNATRPYFEVLKSGKPLVTGGAHLGVECHLFCLLNGFYQHIHFLWILHWALIMGLFWIDLLSTYFWFHLYF